MFMTLTCELSWDAWDDQPLTFTKKMKKSLFEPSFRALRRNVCTPSMARWKARNRLYIRRNWTFFAISYGWDVMSGNQSKSPFREGGWVTLSAYFRGKGASPTNHCWYQSSRVIALSCSIKISVVRHSVLSQYTHLTERQTDRQTDGRREFRQQYCALHYMQSHGKNDRTYSWNCGRKSAGSTRATSSSLHAAM